MEFECYALKYGVKVHFNNYPDGLIYDKDIFKHQDGMKVPLLYNHDHSTSLNNLGYAILENREDGVFVHCIFSETIVADLLSKLVNEQPSEWYVSAFSNKIKIENGHVIAGNIVEISLIQNRVDQDECYQPVIVK